MAEKSRRRLAIEEALAADPGDPFLRYGLAVQCLRDGDTEEGRTRLRALIAEDPASHVAAFQQLGQSLVESGEEDQARDVLARGIARAEAGGDRHAASEMRALLDLIS
jgi:thioredoxin-like negative regulator of GroEL